MIGLIRIVLALDSQPSRTFGSAFGDVLGRTPRWAAGARRSLLKLRSIVVDTLPSVRAVAFSTSSPTTKDAAARPIPPRQRLHRTRIALFLRLPALFGAFRAAVCFGLTPLVLAKGK